MIAEMRRNGANKKDLSDKNRAAVYAYLVGRHDVTMVEIARDLKMSRHTASKHYWAIRKGWKPEAGI